MKIVASRSTLLAFWSAFQCAAPGPAQPHAAAIMERTAATGWIGLMDIENLLLATDARLWRFTTRDVLKVFGVGTQPVFKRPARGAHDAEGLECISAVDLARLLILLERAGLEVDPMPLVDALLPTLRAKRTLTANELAVYWRAERRPDEDLTLWVEMPNFVQGDAYKSRAGHRVEFIFDEEWDGDGSPGEVPPSVAAMIIRPPDDLTHRPASITTRPARRHLRKYLGEPRGDYLPPKPTKRRRQSSAA